MTSTLSVRDLHGGIDGKEIVRGVDFEVRSGEVHAVMGPNGSGKSTLAHLLMGNPAYEATGGSVTLDGVELLGLPVWKRAHAGLFLAMQYPIEVPGVSLGDALAAAVRVQDRSFQEIEELVPVEAKRIGLDERLLSRPLNVDFSGGEKKRNETVQLVAIKPKIAVLDELDSGLDIDALRAVSRRIQDATEEMGIGVLAITHYSQLLFELHPDVVHVLSSGRIVATGGLELAEELERSGYEKYEEE